MPYFNRLSLDDLFEKRCFTQEQYRTLFRLCIDSNCFKSFKRLFEDFERENSKLSHWIFNSISMKELHKLKLSRNMIVTYVLYQLIDNGTQHPF